MLLKVVIFYVFLNVIFAEDSFDLADSSGNVEDGDDVTDHSEEPIPLPSDSISSIDTSLRESSTPGITDLTSESKTPSSSGNQSSEELVIANVITVANETNHITSSNLTRDKSRNLTEDMGTHEITHGKLIDLTNYGKSGSFMPIKGGSNYGGKIYNQDIPRFPQRYYGTWKGTPYTGISNTESVNYGKMFGNPYPMNDFRRMLFHGVQFESKSPKMQGNMRGDDSLGYAFGGFDSEIPFTREHSFGKWMPMHGSGANKFIGEAFGNLEPMMYAHLFGNVYPMHSSMQPSSNNFGYGTTGDFKGNSYRGQDFGMSYSDHFPASMWK